MTPAEMRAELLQVAAALVRGIHQEDIMFSHTTPWYVRQRVTKIVNAADERGRELGIKLKKIADALVEQPRMETEVRLPQMVAQQHERLSSALHEQGCDFHIWHKPQDCNCAAIRAAANRGTDHG